MLARLRHLPGMIHRDERGNFAVLMILCAWVFIGLIALVWNAGEFAERRQHAQMAADSAANAAEVWNARTMNLTTGSNMVIGENASAETLFRAVQITYNNVSGHLNGEQTSVTNRLRQIEQQKLADANKAGGPDLNLQLRLGLEETALNLVVQTLPLEQNEIFDFHAKTASAYDFMTADDFAPRRAEVYAYQQQVVNLLSQTVDNQRSSIQDGFNCDIILASTGGTPDLGGASTPLVPPLKIVQYVNVDPIVHQGVDVTDSLGKNVHVGGGEWGRIDDPPLNRYVTDRAGRDSSGQGMLLRNLMIAIDNDRTNLGVALNKLLTTPQNAPPAIQNDYLLVQQAILGLNIPAPWYNPNATFNGWAYHTPFAQSTWNNAITASLELVLNGMGNDPQFALVTYDRYPIPDWAKPQVRQSAYQNVYTQVYNNNYPNILVGQFNELKQQAQANGTYTAQMDRQLQQQARTLATQITTLGATEIADDVANQWIDQTWPYEIFPPQNPAPMPPGIRKEDRLAYYTVVAAARTNDKSSARLLLPTMFKASTTLVAYAQAETFNWMEYNGGYGASDSYVTWYPPAPWRVSTRGGWSWNPRLAGADGLSNAMINNIAFNEYMDSAGVINDDPAPLQVLNQH